MRQLLLSPVTGKPSEVHRALPHHAGAHTRELSPRRRGIELAVQRERTRVKVIGRYGANAQHTLFYVVEANDVNAVQKFLWPGFKRCTATVTPVSEVPVPKD